MFHYWTLGFLFLVVMMYSGVSLKTPGLLDLLGVRDSLLLEDLFLRGHGLNVAVGVGHLGVIGFNSFLVEHFLDFFWDLLDLFTLKVTKNIPFGVWAYPERVSCL